MASGGVVKLPGFPSLPSPSVVIGVVVVVTLLGAAVWIQTARLKVARLELAQTAQVAEANLAAATAEKVAKELADKAGADRLKQEQEKRAAAEVALREYRDTVQGVANACHFAVVDPSVDRLLSRPRAGRGASD